MAADRRCLLSPAAESDLEDIWRYTEGTWSTEQAEHYLREIIAAFGELAAGRRQGRKVQVRPGYLKHAVGSHVIYFRDRGLWIEIIRVLHRRQDVDSNL